MLVASLKAMKALFAQDDESSSKSKQTHVVVGPAGGPPEIRPDSTLKIIQTHSQKPNNQEPQKREPQQAATKPI